MTALFTAQEKEEAFHRRKVWLTVYIVVSVLLWLGNAAAITLFSVRVMPKGWAMFVDILLTAVWGAGTLFFFGLQFPPLKHFCRMLKNMERGLKDEVTLRFVRFQEEPVTKDGVEFYTMIMFVKPNKLGLAEGERNVLVEKSKEKPDVREGDILRIKTHANILMEYEIVTSPLSS